MFIYHLIYTKQPGITNFDRRNKVWADAPNIYNMNANNCQPIKFAFDVIQANLFAGRHKCCHPM